MNIQQLGKAAQQQILQQQKKALHLKSNKYNNNKTVIRNITFDSAEEAKRYQELLILQRAGVITDLQCQVKYQLIPTQKRPDGKTERSVSYIADFVYSDGNNTVVEDTKGFKTKDYIIKRKLMLYVHGIAVKEV